MFLGDTIQPAATTVPATCLSGHFEKLWGGSGDSGRAPCGFACLDFGSIPQQAPAWGVGVLTHLRPDPRPSLLFHFGGSVLRPWAPRSLNSHGLNPHPLGHMGLKKASEPFANSRLSGSIDVTSWLEGPVRGCAGTSGWLRPLGTRGRSEQVPGHTQGRMQR